MVAFRGYPEFPIVPVEAEILAAVFGVEMGMPRVSFESWSGVGGKWGDGGG